MIKHLPPPRWVNYLILTALSVGLLSWFLIIPVCRVGWWNYLSTEKDMNPLIAILLGKYQQRQASKLSEEWYNRVRVVAEAEIPRIEWEEDSTSSQGIHSFYCLDQQSDDCRPLLMKEWNLPYDKTLWWNAHHTNEYLFTPDKSGAPIYNMERTDSTLSIQTGEEYDTWVYLVAKEPQANVYALDFDFITHTKVQETLQICFASTSLAQRFRFNLENNETIRFSVIDHAYFLSGYRKDLWEQLRKPYSIPLHTPVHVTLQCIGNHFALFFDHKLVMAVEVDGYEPRLDYWYLIFWNGVPTGGYKGKQDTYINIEIKNFKIFHARE